MENILFNPILEAGLYNNLPVKEMLSYAGMNTGNMVFVDSLKKQIKFQKEVWFDTVSINELSEKSIGILPCANMINVNDTFLDDTYLLKKNKKITFPITLVGLGAQSTVELNTPKKLMSAMPIQRINAIKSLCNQVFSIGIRGEFTAECLEIIGVKNFRIIGCPSLYLYEDKFKELKLPSIKKSVFNTANYVIDEYKLLNLGIKNNLLWIMQTMSEMPKTVFENCELTGELVQKRFPGFNGSLNELEVYMRKNGRMFFSMLEWYDFMRNEDFSFSFGGRFHGNVVALRSGIPALWITHDSRTKELIELFNLPSINSSKLQDINTVEDLVQYCTYHDFYKTYPKMFNEYKKFLDENNINHIWG
jgi:hypothetical protein